MRSTRFSFIRGLSLVVAFNFGLGACQTAGTDNGGTGGGNAAGTGGSPGSGGATGSGGETSTGGTPGSGGAVGSGGDTSTGGSSGSGGATGSGGEASTGGTSGSGGSTGTGGDSGSGGSGSGGSTGSGGRGAGGMTATGGMTGGGGRGGMTGTGGGTGSGGTTGSGGASTGDCVKGQTKGKDVAVIGESFIALSHQITQEIETQAKNAGSLPQGDKYVDNSVSGTTLANNQIPSQYTKAVQSSGTIKYVLMDGGGNDCLINNNGAAALTAATSLFQTMAQDKTEKVVYFFYPDPIGTNFSSLKSCLDALRPQMKALCDGLTAPKCYWLDLRPIWNGHNEYTSDGIHPTASGAKATGDAIWDVMKTNCVAQ